MLSWCSLAQSENTDSLRQAINSADSDSIKVELYNQLAWQLKHLDIPEALKSAQSGLDLAIAIDDPSQEAQLYNSLGGIYREAGLFDDALQAYFRAQDIFRQLSNRFGLSITANNLGNLQLSRGNLEEAKEHFIESLNLHRTLSAEGDVKATNQIPVILSNLADLNKELGNCTKALELCEEAIALSIGTENEYKGVFYRILGDILRCQKNYARAREVFEESRMLTQKSGMRNDLIDLYLDLGNLELETGDTSKAIRNFQEGLLLSEKVGAIKRVAELSEGLSTIYYQLGEYKSSIDYLKQKQKANDSIFDQDRTLKIALLEVQNAFKNRQRQDDLERNAKEVEQKAEQERSILLRNFLIGLVIFVLLVTIFMFKVWQRQTRTNHLLKEKNRQIGRQKEAIESYLTELEKAHRQIQESNQNLEEKVKERTRDLEMQTASLRKYAFITSHQIRGPLSNLLGMVELFSHPDLDKEEREKMLAHLKSATTKLDETVRKSVEILEQDNSNSPSPVIPKPKSEGDSSEENDEKVRSDEVHAGED